MFPTNSAQWTTHCESDSPLASLLKLPLSVGGARQHVAPSTRPDHRQRSWAARQYRLLDADGRQRPVHELQADQQCGASKTCCQGRLGHSGRDDLGRCAVHCLVLHGCQWPGAASKGIVGCRHPGIPTRQSGQCHSQTRAALTTDSRFWQAPSYT